MIRGCLGFDARQRAEWNGGVMVTEIDNDQRREVAHDVKLLGNTPLLRTGVITSYHWIPIDKDEESGPVRRGQSEQP